MKIHIFADGTTVAAMPAGTMETPYQKITLLDLLIELQAHEPLSEQALVRLVLRLIRTRRVVLCGTYAGTGPCLD